MMLDLRSTVTLGLCCILVSGVLGDPSALPSSFIRQRRAASPSTLQRLQWNQYTILQASELVATGECSDYVVGVQLNSLTGQFEEGRLELGTAGTRCFREVDIRGSTTVNLRLSSYECRDQMEERMLPVQVRVTLGSRTLTTSVKCLFQMDTTGHRRRSSGRRSTANTNTDAVVAKPQILLSEEEFKVVGYCEENQMRIILRSTEGFDGLVHLGKPGDVSCFKDIWGLSQKTVQLTLKYADCKKYPGQVAFGLPLGVVTEDNRVLTANLRCYRPYVDSDEIPTTTTAVAKTSEPRKDVKSFSLLRSRALTIDANCGRGMMWVTLSAPDGFRGRLLFGKQGTTCFKEFPGVYYVQQRTTVVLRLSTARCASYDEPMMVEVHSDTETLASSFCCAPADEMVGDDPASSGSAEEDDSDDSDVPDGAIVPTNQMTKYDLFNSWPQNATMSANDVVSAEV